MTQGVFNLPMSDYYAKSSEIKGKVTELIESVQNDYLTKVSNNIGTLDDTDASAVEGFDSYTSAKTQLTTVQEHETKLTNMSSEGDSNPMNGVVSIDKEYAGTFSGLSNGSANEQVAGVISGQLASSIEGKKLRLYIEEQIRNVADSADNDWVQRMLQLAATNPAEALAKLYDNKKFIEIISKSEGASDFFLATMGFIENAKYVPKDLMEALSNNSTFVNWAGKLSPAMQDKVLNAMVKVIDGGYDLMNKGGKLVDWITTVAKSKPVQIASKLANSKLGKVITNPLVSMAVSGGIAAVSDYYDKDSKAHGDVGKAIAGGAVEAIASIGPIDGALMGAKFGPWGAVAGFALGGASQIAQFFFPDLKDQAKDLAYKAVDGARELGKAAVGKAKEAVSAVSDGIGKAASAVGDFFSGGSKVAASWFG